MFMQFFFGLGHGLEIRSSLLKLDKNELVSMVWSVGEKEVYGKIAFELTIV